LETDGGILRVHRRNDRDTHVDVAAALTQLNAPILCTPALCDVQIREDLDAAYERFVHAQWRRRLIHKDAVDTETNRNPPVKSFDVDVRCTKLHGPLGGLVEEANNRSF